MMILKIGIWIGLILSLLIAYLVVLVLHRVSKLSKHVQLYLIGFDILNFVAFLGLIYLISD